MNFSENRRLGGDVNSAIARPGCAFCVYNFAFFMISLRDFGTLSPSKANPGAAKVNAFRRFLVGQAMGRFFAIAKPESIVFRVHFAVILDDLMCILLSFFMILDARLEA